MRIYLHRPLDVVMSVGTYQGTYCSSLPYHVDHSRDLNALLVIARITTRNNT